MSKKAMNVLDLKCCQIALGMLEVKKKVKAYKLISRKNFKKESKQNPVSVIIGPDKSGYIVDGHHHCAAAWLAGHLKIYVKVVKDFSKSRISYHDFWKYLKEHDCVHLYDQYGDGPRDPLYLPQDVRGLGDDPYRSLAWLVRKKGAIRKVKRRFADFEWANYFRKKKILHGHFERHFKSATEKALRLAGSKAARNLPGFIELTHSKEG